MVNHHQSINHLLHYLMLAVIVFLLVSTPSASANNLQIESTLSANQVWQREQTIVSISVQTDDPFGRLQVDNFKQENFTIIPLKKQINEEINTSSNTGPKRYILTKRWAIFPFAAGIQPLKLPRVRYRPSRGSVKTLDVPNLSLNVKKLPIYVPATMPVGEIKLQGIWGHGAIITSNELLYWNITVTGIGVARQTLPALSQQIKTDTSLDILPINKAYSTKETRQGLTQQIKYTIPLKAKRIGKLNFPSLIIQYFDPNTATIRSSQLPPLWVLALNQWLKILISLLAISALIFVSLILIKWLARYLKHNSQKSQLLSQLESAKSHHQILKILQQLSILQGWKKPLSLRDFLVLWNHSCGITPNSDTTELETSIYEIEAYLFSPSPQTVLKDATQILAKELRDTL